MSTPLEDWPPATAAAYDAGEVVWWDADARRWRASGDEEREARAARAREALTQQQPASSRPSGRPAGGVPPHARTPRRQTAGTYTDPRCPDCGRPLADDAVRLGGRVSTRLICMEQDECGWREWDLAPAALEPEGLAS